MGALLRKTMLDHVGKWEASGLTQKQYSTANNLSYFVFHHWRREYRKTPSVKKLPASAFVQLKVKPSLASVSNAEIILPDGRRIIFHQPVSSDFLKAILS